MEHEFIIDSKTMTIKECWFSDELGATIWSSAYVMLKFVEHKRELIEDKRIIELGSGTGIVGIAAAIVGANSVTVTDIEPLVGLMEENIRINNVNLTCKAAALPWGYSVGHLDTPFEVVLISDVITDIYKHDFPKLVQSMRDVSDTNTRIYMAIENRFRSSLDVFQALVNEHFASKKIVVENNWNQVYEDEKRFQMFEFRLKSTM